MKTGTGQNGAAKRAANGARGFTLIEALVAIGAIAVIAVGLAAVFDTVGRTVAGGRRVSLLNTYASVLEAQMRRDFESMDPDGFLMIRQQVATGEKSSGGNGQILVEAYPDDPTPRYRRIDEIMFLAGGEYRSMREPVVRGVEAASRQARIYYGHMASWTDEGTTFAQPSAFDGEGRQRYTLGEQPGSGQRNPNRYAGDWTLGRHVTLLALPETTLISIPPTPSGIVSNPDLIQNSDFQIGGQPAAVSLFRVVNSGWPLRGGAVGGTGRPPYLRNSILGEQNPAVFASGIVDIATTDAAEVRQFVTTFNLRPDQMVVQRNPQIQVPRNLDGKLRWVNPDPGNAPGSSQAWQDLRRMQLWMDQMWPANSTTRTAGAVQGDRPKQRIRYERVPPDLRAALAETNAGEAALRRADQQTLGAWGFVPRCTEFKVEWSFGQRYFPTDATRGGQLIWYGARDDTNLAPGEQDSAGKAYEMTWYDDTLPQLQYRPNRAAPAGLGEVSQDFRGYTNHLVQSELIYDYTTLPSAGTPAEECMTSLFGAIDPFYRPFDRADPDSLAWTWPKLVRITVSIADAQDPSIEQQFQFVLEVPSRPR